MVYFKRRYFANKKTYSLEEKIIQYYLENLLIHEIGHSLDSFNKRFWSKATEQ